MSTQRREYQAVDARPVVLHGKKDLDSPTAYPLIVDSDGRLIISPTSGDVSSATCSSITVAATSTQVLAARTDRTAAIIINDSDEEIYICYGATATLNSGIRLNKQGGTLIEDVYVGIVTAICTSGSKNLTVTEL